MGACLSPAWQNTGQTAPENSEVSEDPERSELAVQTIEAQLEQLTVRMRAQEAARVQAEAAIDAYRNLGRQLTAAEADQS